MPKQAPDPEVIDLLERWLSAAQKGTLQDVMLVGRFSDGSYADDWRVAEEALGDVVLEVRSTVIRMQTVKDAIVPLTEH